MATSSPCAGCKFLRRKCTPECVFAPYFPPDQPQKFVSVHKIFGASNVTKLLNELPPHQREDAVNSLAYEAESRVKDPVYGCVGAISLLQRKVVQLQQELATTQAVLSRMTSGMGGTSTGAVHQGGSSLSPGLGVSIPGPSHHQLEHTIKREPPSELSRDQQLYELAKFGGTSYEESFTALSSTRNTGIQSGPGNSAGSGSSTGGGGIIRN